MKGGRRGEHEREREGEKEKQTILDGVGTAKHQQLPQPTAADSFIAQCNILSKKLQADWRRNAGAHAC